MKLPKAFVPKKNLEKTVERLLKNPKVNPDRVSLLLDHCEEIVNMNHFNLTKIIKIGREAANELKYTKEDLEIMSLRLSTVRTNFWLGLYISILLNKVIKEDDEVILNFGKEMSCLGSFLERGTIIIPHDVDYNSGWFMRGGRLIIEGNAGYRTGENMRGGDIYVDGIIKYLSKSCGGNIYKKGIKVWPI